MSLCLLSLRVSLSPFLHVCLSFSLVISFSFISCFSQPLSPPPSLSLSLYIYIYIYISLYPSLCPLSLSFSLSFYVYFSLSPYLSLTLSLTLSRVTLFARTLCGDMAVHIFLTVCHNPITEMPLAHASQPLDVYKLMMSSFTPFPSISFTPPLVSISFSLFLSIIRSPSLSLTCSYSIGLTIFYSCIKYTEK